MAGCDLFRWANGVSAPGRAQCNSIGDSDGASSRRGVCVVIHFTFDIPVLSLTGFHRFPFDDCIGNMALEVTAQSHSSGKI